MIQWIERHAAGWESLLAAYLVVAVGVAVLQRRGLERRVLAVPLVTWVGLCSWTYATSGMHRFLGYARPRWLAMLFTLLVVTAVPVAGIALAARWKRVRQGPPVVAFTVPIVMAVLGIPLTNLLSAALYTLLRPHFS